MLIGVAGMTFTIIFLQIILFQLLTIFSDYLQANGIISIALLGISAGSLIGYFSARSRPLQSMLAGSLLLPVAILIAFGAVLSLTETRPFLTSALLMLPFVCASAVITVALARTRSHVVYFVDLLGAAFGALLVSAALSRLREENSLLFLAALTCLMPVCFILLHPSRRARLRLYALALTGAAALVAAGYYNLAEDRLNIIRTHIERRYPDGAVLFSRSSLVGRYDIVRRDPAHSSLSAYENGRIIDTLRRRPTEEYQIDPRLPHTLMEDPVILILGVSGDGISKTSKSLGAQGLRRRDQPGDRVAADQRAGAVQRQQLLGHRCPGDRRPHLPQPGSPALRHHHLDERPFRPRPGLGEHSQPRVPAHGGGDGVLPRSPDRSRRGDRRGAGQQSAPRAAGVEAPRHHAPGPARPRGDRTPSGTSSSSSGRRGATTTSRS